MRKLRLPETLVFAVLSAGAIATGAGCEEGGETHDAATADAYEGCHVFCLPIRFYDDGGPLPDGGPACLVCADENSACPSGCHAVG
jgi:hypothetical protein